MPPQAIPGSEMGLSSAHSTPHLNTTSNRSAEQPSPVSVDAGTVQTPPRPPSQDRQSVRTTASAEVKASSPSHTPPADGRVTPAPTPDSAFAPKPVFPAFDAFMGDGSFAESMTNAVTSPLYSIDTPQMSMMMSGYEQFQDPDMLMNTPAPMSFGSSEMSSDPVTSMMPPFIPQFEPVPGMLQTPTSNAGFERRFSDGPPSTPIRPNAHRDHSAADGDAIIAGQDAWSAYRCTPGMPPSACPKTARINLEKLEESLRDHEAWADWRLTWDEADFSNGEHLEVLSFQEMPRDKLLAITQVFLHKALDIHSDDPGLSNGLGALKESSSNFVILPPARVLEYFLKSYANSFERFYPLLSHGVLDPNILMLKGKDKASSLLLLLMIAQGALITPSVDGRWLTGGLTEACRISLFDLIEKNIMMSGDPMVLHSALLFTVQAGWSGDKWQMDIAMGQRGMYFAMLRHSGYLEAPPPQPPTLTRQGNVEQLWHEWMQQESRSRLVYAWVMVDQDLSLFHDTPPLFSVTEFGAPMPDTDMLWHARSAAEWSGIFERVHEFSGGYSSVGSGARPLCLRDLFRLFINDTIVAQDIQLTPLHLRLLLHPLQSLVCQFRQLMNCLPDAGARQNGNSMTAASTRIRLEEVQGMLQRWYGLADRYLKSNPFCPLMQANLIMFHLVSLNAVVDFPKIEQLARRDGLENSYQSTTTMHQQCVTDVEEAIFHSGQIIRLIRVMPRSIRPPWWPGAVYRAAMVFWCDSLVQNNRSKSAASSFTPTESMFPVDGLLPDHPMIVQYLTKREGIPVLTRRDGSQLAIDNPFAVLFHCVDIIAEGVSTRFSDGICNKLSKLARS